MPLARDDRLLTILSDANSALGDAITSAEAVPLDVVVLGVINRLSNQRDILAELAAEIESDRRARIEDERDAAADARLDEMRDDRLVP